MSETIPEVSATETAETATSPEQAATPAAEPQKFKVKLPDGEREVELDELLSGYQLKQASYKKFEEASAKEKAAQAHREQLKKDFIKALVEDPEIGKDRFKEEVIKFLYEEFQEEEMSPEQLKAKKYDEMMKAREAEEARRREEEEAAAEEAEVARQVEELAVKYTKALDGVRLPKTTSTVRAMAYLHQVSEEAGVELDDQGLASMTRDALFAEQKQLFLAAIPEGRILDVIDPEVLDAIRKADLQRIRARKNAKSVSASDYAAGEDAGAPKRLSPDEALKRFLESA